MELSKLSLWHRMRMMGVSILVSLIVEAIPLSLRKGLKKPSECHISTRLHCRLPEQLTEGGSNPTSVRTAMD